MRSRSVGVGRSRSVGVARSLMTKDLLLSFFLLPTSALCLQHSWRSGHHLLLDKIGIDLTLKKGWCL